MHSVAAIWYGRFRECLKKWLAGAYFGGKNKVIFDGVPRGHDAG
jgi:hypothetical protein